MGILPLLYKVFCHIETMLYNNISTIIERIIDFHFYIYFLFAFIIFLKFFLTPILLIIAFVFLLIALVFLIPTSMVPRFGNTYI